ncbi:alkaline phosphatase family protein [Oceanibaculum nanhaiense]|uniref:alkaline phosphatase family protein n=1 Tax=Oceanibaculum nanhaiense TaxID=1909734 RepID=UPI003F70C391
MAVTKPRNILLITADQWRGDTVGAAGHPLVRTPNIDALAAEGTFFRRHYANASPCGPSRASLLTGLYPHNHRSIRNGTPLEARFTNIALEARKAGYDPVLFGYTDSAADPRELPPGDPRLETYEGVLPGFTVGQRMAEDSKPWLASLKVKGYAVPGPGYAIYRPDPAAVTPDKGPTYAPARFRAGDSETHWLTDRVIEHLSMQGEEPFFVHLSYLRPHPPFIAPEPYHAMYDPAEVPPPLRGDIAEEKGRHPLLKAMLEAIPQSAFFQPNGGTGEGLAADMSARDMRQLRATYYALLSEVDDNLGRLFGFLKREGLWEDTLVVLTSDHGEMLGDHFLLGKQGWFDGAFHIPLIVRAPGMPGGRQVTDFTESVDVMPTVLDVLGLEVPDQCDGRPLTGFLEGQPAPEDWRDAACFLFDFRDARLPVLQEPLGLKADHCTLMGWRGERWKYVHFTALPPLLFDMAHDPQETRNLANDPAHAGVMLDCAQRLLSWRMEHEYGALANLMLGPGGVVKGR